VAGDVTLTWGPSISYVEVLRQTGERNDAFHPFSRLGYDDATYSLVGTRWQVCKRLNLRVNWSRVDYKGSGARNRDRAGLVYGSQAARPDRRIRLVEKPAENRSGRIHREKYNLVLHFTF